MDEAAGRPPVPGLPEEEVPGLQVHGHRPQFPLVRTLLGNDTYYKMVGLLGLMNSARYTLVCTV